MKLGSEGKRDVGRALHPKWLQRKSRRLKNQRINNPLPLENLFGNLNVYEEIDQLDSGGRTKSNAMAIKESKKFFKRRGRFSGDPNHLIGEYSKLPKNNDQRAFIRGAWSDNGEDEVGKTKDETCLVAQAPDEI
ncbi:hypothetical protein Tco_0356904 [Tanacetum coccineum]